MTLVIDLSPETEARLQQAALSEGMDIPTFLLDAVETRLRQRAPTHPRMGTELLAKINKGFSETFWNRYRALIAKRRAETLTPKERQELIGLAAKVYALSLRAGAV